MDTQMTAIRTAKIKDHVGHALPHLLNKYTPSAIPERYLILERSVSAGVVRAWECNNLDNAARLITGNDDQDFRFQVIDLDHEGENAVMMPVLAVTDIIGEGRHWRQGEANTGDVTLQQVHTTFLNLVVMMADPKAKLKLTLTEGDGNSVTVRLDVSKGDIGAIVGREGRTARLLRSLLYNIGGRMNKRFSLDIRETPL